MRRSGLGQNITALVFLSPFIVIFAIFLAYPLFYSFYLSLHKVTALVNVFENLSFVGFQNFIDLLNDGLFRWSLLMTLYYAALIVPLGIAGSLLLAVLLNNKLRLHRLFRTAFFLPYVLDLFVVGIVWTFIYSPHFGVLTRIFEAVGITYFSEQGFLGRPARCAMGSPARCLKLILTSGQCCARVACLHVIRDRRNGKSPG